MPFLLSYPWCLGNMEHWPCIRFLFVTEINKTINKSNQIYQNAKRKPKKDPRSNFIFGMLACFVWFVTSLCVRNERPPKGTRLKSKNRSFGAGRCYDSYLLLVIVKFFTNYTVSFHKSRTNMTPSSENFYKCANAESLKNKRHV